MSFQKIKKQNVLVALRVALWTVSVAISSANMVASDHLAAGSYIESYFANNLSWRKGDVLIRTVEYWDSRIGKDSTEGSMIFESKVFHRYVFDHDENCYFVAYFGEHRTTEQHSEGIDERVVPIMSAFAFQDGTGIGRHFPSRQFQSNLKDCVRLFHQFDLPDLRKVGLASIRSFDNNLDSFVAALCKQPGKVHSSNNRSLQITFRRNLPEVSGISSSYEFALDFDPERLIPTRLSIFNNIHNGTNEARLNRGSSEFFWKEIDGVHVPVRIASTEPSNIIGKNGKRHLFIRFEDIDCHWFSLNRPLDSRFFRWKDFSDWSKLKDLVDPVKSGADTLK